MQRLLYILALACSAALFSACATPTTAVQGESLAETLARADREFEARQYGQALVAYRMVAFASSNARDAAPFVESASQVASVLALQGLPSDAHSWLAQAQERATPDAPRAWTRFLLGRGLVDWKEGRDGEALANFSELFQFCFLHGETARAIQASQMASVVSRGAEQIEWARRGIQTAAASGKPGWEGPLWANLGWLLDARGLTDEALEAFERALSLAKQSEATRIGRARAEWAYAHALRKAGRSEDAQRALDYLFDVLSGLYARERTPVVAEYFGRTLMDLAELDAQSGATLRAQERFRAARARLIEAGAVEGAPELLAELDRRLAELER
ncbi:MAG: tetratricopeptide repeat protein [Planctomycetota bacterium]